MSLAKVAEQIKKSKSFLITTHSNPEGDAIGSEMALRELLVYLGKKAVIVNEDSAPNEYKFLPGIEQIKRPKEVNNIAFDTSIALDCSDPGRFKKLANLFAKGKVKINIDHHISNSGFGDINWVEPNSSSASEMIYELYKRLRVPLDKNKALYLYTGILTDTGSFHYLNTTSRTMQIAADLLRYDLNVNAVYRNIYENFPFSDIKLLTKIITTMKSDMQHRIIWFRIKRGLLKGSKVSIDLTEHILSFGRMIRGAEVVVLFKENLKNRDQIRINLRSKRLDVNKIAKIFGGGGHRSASGATVCGSLKSAERRVIDKIKQQLGRF